MVSLHGNDERVVVDYFGPSFKKKTQNIKLKCFLPEIEVHQKEKQREFQAIFDLRAIFVNDHLSLSEISQPYGLMQK